MTEQEIKDLWEDCDPSEWLPEVCRYDGTLFPEFAFFVKEVQKRSFEQSKILQDECKALLEQLNESTQN